jgi:signal transduction histidine kinase
MDESLKFKISSNLKNLIGKDLINNKYIAVFELVKNSYDANATKVTIIFKDLGSKDAKIIIADDGFGMNKQDIIQKWLFVAYSEKRHHYTQTDSNDYRNRLKRNYAGAKGVGRFSCDRLGQFLRMETTTQSEKKIHQINVDWSDFEDDDLKEFISINVDYSEIDKPTESNSGTTLFISGLRESWNRTDLLDLKKSLMKLCSPLENEAVFEIELVVPQEKEEDLKISKLPAATNVRGENDFSYNIVNGLIVNDLIKKLNMKTTSISVSISHDGETLKTELSDRGIDLFTILEKNIFKELSNIEIKILYLNRAAKANFTRQMGIEPVNYGSIFIYKNAFRIYPYGEPGVDFFGINRRKAQGYNRYFGTREMIGYIRIKGDSNYFYETTSRDGGFVRSDATVELEELFLEKALKILEKYVVNGIDWGDPNKEDYIIGENEQGTMPMDVANEILAQFVSISHNDTILSATINPDILKKVTPENTNNKLNKYLKNLNKIAERESSKELNHIVKSIEKQISELKSQKEISDKAVDETYSKLINAEDEIYKRKEQQEKMENKLNKDVAFLEEGYHLIAKYTESISDNIKSMQKQTENTKILGLIDEIADWNNRIKIQSDLSIYGNYKDLRENSYNVVEFFESMIENNTINNNGLKKLYFVINNYTNKPLMTRFPRSSLASIFDNVLSNSVKAEAKSLRINLELKEKNIIIDFVDDGKGLYKKIEDPNIIFERGYSSTNGTGLGLTHIKRIVEEDDGYALYSPSETGFCIKVGIRHAV